VYHSYVFDRHNSPHAPPNTHGAPNGGIRFAVEKPAMLQIFSDALVGFDLKKMQNENNLSKICEKGNLPCQVNNPR